MGVLVSGFILVGLDAGFEELVVLALLFERTDFDSAGNSDEIFCSLLLPIEDNEASGEYEATGVNAALKAAVMSFDCSDIESAELFGASDSPCLSHAVTVNTSKIVIHTAINIFLFMGFLPRITI